MVARRSQAFTTEDWNGFWGTDARYYARRSDGACFAIDAAAMVFDLAGSATPSSHAHPVASLPRSGRYTMRVLVARSVMASTRPVAGETKKQTSAESTRPRVFACGVRRAVPR